MNEAIFDIFVKDENKFRLTYLFFLAPPFFFILVFISNIFNIKWFSIFFLFFLASLSLLLILGVISIFLKQKLRGELEGKLIFTYTYIKVNDEKYFLDEIEKIEFSTYDYEGFNTCRRNYPRRKILEFGCISQGVDNYVLLVLKNEKKLLVSFKRVYKMEFSLYEDLFANYYKKNIISYFNLLHILQLENDYDEIQKFKKEYNIENKKEKKKDSLDIKKASWNKYDFDKKAY